jgi:hypothetical protein
MVCSKAALGKSKASASVGVSVRRVAGVCGCEVQSPPMRWRGRRHEWTRLVEVGHYATAKWVGTGMGHTMGTGQRTRGEKTHLPSKPTKKVLSYCLAYPGFIESIFSAMACWKALISSNGELSSLFQRD